jgi:hypothetical protein
MNSLSKSTTSYKTWTSRRAHGKVHPMGDLLAEEEH